MATINSEILLTQNLYQSFIDAKSRVTKKEWACNDIYILYIISSYLYISNKQFVSGVKLTFQKNETGHVAEADQQGLKKHRPYERS